MAATAEDTRAARDFLKRKGLLGKGVSAKQLAGAKSELGKPFSQVLLALADMLDAGQGQGPSERTQDERGKAGESVSNAG